jgi:Phage tail assembly chaperone protein
MYINGYFHDLMIAVIKDHYPGLIHGKDFYVGHFVHPATGAPAGDPTIVAWYSEVDRPTDESIHALFRADEARYRADYLRTLRDEALHNTDGRGNLPDDAPPSLATLADSWRVFRQALRDLPEQPNFPFDVEWPVSPTQAVSTPK